jgi:LruC domain-containing protein
MKKNSCLILLILSVCIISCKKEGSSLQPQATRLTTADSTIAASFDFKTTRLVSVNINFASSSNEAIANVPVNVYANAAELGDPLLTAMTDANGALNAQVEVPAYVDTLIVDAKYIGLIRNAKAAIVNSTVNGTIGGTSGLSGNIAFSVYNTALTNKIKSLNLFRGRSLVNNNTSYSPMGSWDDAGVPTYLVQPGDVISSQLLSDLNTSLPETIDVRKLHPQYLASTVASDLVITQTANVWVTFVSEGAGYLNTVGYFTYPTNNPPKTADDIKTIYYMFPNASMPGSGGYLRPGNKVKLGTFSAGTSIGFVLLSNAYNYGAKTVSTSGYKFFTDAALNPETDPKLQKHTVLLSDNNDHYCICFEDLFRQSPSCDHDFNDVIIYASADPVKAISANLVIGLDQVKDSDGDGVPDNLDAFPNDPQRAYINYYPSASSFATVAFEDLWPATGDYDLNDMVIGYRYKMISNAQKNVVETFADYVVEGAGASYISGFGVQFPFSPNLVKTVTGQKAAGSYIKLNSNGTEAGQSKTVIVPFDSYHAVIKRPNPYYINTQLSAPFVTGDTVHVYMGFVNPLPLSTFGTAPFNPFLISNQRRGYEVHLPNSVPTDLADKTLFGTFQDASNPAKGIYYKSKKGWPWALNFAGPFNYPVEGVNISKVYNYFLPWAQSNGALHPDWFLTSPGYENSTLVYKH